MFSQTKIGVVGSFGSTTSLNCSHLHTPIIAIGRHFLLSVPCASGNFPSPHLRALKESYLPLYYPQKLLFEGWFATSIRVHSLPTHPLEIESSIISEEFNPIPYKQ